MLTTDIDLEHRRPAHERVGAGGALLESPGRAAPAAPIVVLSSVSAVPPSPSGGVVSMPVAVTRSLSGSAAGFAAATASVEIARGPFGGLARKVNGSVVTE
jgi:hypothetical protein